MDCKLRIYVRLVRLWLNNTTVTNNPTKYTAAFLDQCAAPMQIPTLQDSFLRIICVACIREKHQIVAAL